MLERWFSDQINGKIDRTTSSQPLTKKTNAGEWKLNGLFKLQSAQAIIKPEAAFRTSQNIIDRSQIGSKAKPGKTHSEQTYLNLSRAKIDCTPDLAPSQPEHFRKGQTAMKETWIWTDMGLHL